MSDEENKILNLEKKVNKLEYDLNAAYSNYISTLMFVTTYLTIKTEHISFSFFGFYFSEERLILLSFLVITLMFLKKHINYTKSILKKIILGEKK